MQKILPFLGLLLVFACSPNSSLEDISNGEGQGAIENNDPKNSDSGNTSSISFQSKEDILAYFDELIANEQVIVGQHCGDGPKATASYYDLYVDMLADDTGRHVGIVGADFGWFTGDHFPVEALIDHARKGGLVTVNWHADNPFADGVDVYWNTVENKDKIDLKALLRDAEKTSIWTSYRTELDNVAGGLQKLRDAGITVIWRPFHEMNGDFFWWGIDAYNNQQTNQEDFKRLWKDLHYVLTYDYGLDNLIWTYSVVPDEGWSADVTSYYPGSDYVDLVGMDYYGASPEFPNYEALKSLGKTIVMSESGPRDEGYGNWNMMQLVNTLKGKAAYFLQWHSWNGAKVAIKDNENTIQMMQSDAAITLDELIPVQ